MIEFFQRLFGKPASSATAKERLRLVLLSDHLSLAPDVVEALKHDLVEVISRYVEVDASNCDVTFEQREKQIAMLANIPILGMRTRPKPPAAPPPAPPPPPPAREPETTPSLDLGGATAAVAAAPEAQPEIVEAVAEPVKRASANGNGSRKRRRKRPSGTAVPSPG
ncbi:MAG TPA: cell division topological specificity factor MinE [Candidatus Elarobacter sp.]|nr:cell division topological specificity factor MinE [Candidatus Elarobacter sp.]